MSLPGVASARRRRASHGRSAALMQPHVRLTKPTPPCGIEEDAGTQDHADGGLHRRVMAARRRLDEKLHAGGSKTSKASYKSSRAEYSSMPKHVGSSVYADGWRSGAMIIGVLPAPTAHMKRAGDEMLISTCAGQSVREERAVASSSYLQEECPVCLDSFLPGHLVMRLPCSHTFHTSCLLPWIQAHSHCPFCRATISN